MKIIYLGAHTAKLNIENVIYQDINGKRDIAGDMLEIDLEPYDFIIATPPCNYWSKANYRRESSEYSQKTKHLLPDILDKLKKIDKPYIVENVRNEKLFKKYGILDRADYVYYIGRHTYFTNIPFNPLGLEQKSDNIQNTSTKNRQGGDNVNKVIEYYIKTLTKKNKYDSMKLIKQKGE